MDNYLIAAYLIGYAGFMIHMIIKSDNPFQENNLVEYTKFIVSCMFFALFWPVILMAGIFNKIMD